MREIQSIDNPNLSIVLPGNCSANCSFCFGKNKKTDLSVKEYLVELRKVLNALPKHFKTVSITGSEPTESPYLIPVLKELQSYIRYSGELDRVVLSTNGLHLKKIVNSSQHQELLKNVLTHVNVSRHHYNMMKNREIFNVDRDSVNVPCTISLQIIRERLADLDIEMSLSFVYDNSTFNYDNMENFIEYAKHVGVVGLRCRYDQQLTDSLDPSALEDEYLQYHTIDETFCPVCRHKVQSIDGMKVTWIYSLLEPSTEMNAIYELIFQHDGRLTADWEGLTEVVL
jgi:molybdenum cofactor biosynthesis enzyme MoaA